jgi:hypothetical protein
MSAGMHRQVQSAEKLYLKCNDRLEQGMKKARGRRGLGILVTVSFWGTSHPFLREPCVPMGTIAWEVYLMVLLVCLVLK